MYTLYNNVWRDATKPRGWRRPTRGGRERERERVVARTPAIERSHEWTRIDPSEESLGNSGLKKEGCRTRGPWLRPGRGESPPRRVDKRGGEKRRLGLPSRMERRRRSAASGAPSSADSLASPPGLCATLSMLDGDGDSDDNARGNARRQRRRVWEKESQRRGARARYSMAARPSTFTRACRAPFISAAAGRQLRPSADARGTFGSLSSSRGPHGTPAINLRHRRRHHHHWPPSPPSPSPPPLVATAAAGWRATPLPGRQTTPAAGRCVSRLAASLARRLLIGCLD